MIDRRDNSGNIILLLNNYTIIIELVDYISRDGPDMPYM